jgi:8-oxo-dGTP pyrophosphatase MutT (NUDIX family)
VAPGQVCFPGGAVEPDEDRDAAAVREMKEELGIDLTVTGPIWQHVFDNRPLILWGYLANEVAADLVPDPYEVAEVLWLNRREVLNHPDAMPMTELFVEALEAASPKHD